MLHVTNGDSAREAIEALGLPGRVLGWKDVYYDGPAPTLGPDGIATRADWIASRGWASRKEAAADFRDAHQSIEDELADPSGELVLWFECDLHDQLQLMYLLAWISATRGPIPGISLVPSPRDLRNGGFIGLSTCSPEHLLSLHKAKRVVSGSQLKQSMAAWTAFAAEDPTSLNTVVETSASPLPHLVPAVRRWIAEYPALRSGLSRTERYCLDSTAGNLAATFLELSWREPAPFLGDRAFLAWLEPIIRGSAPLLEFVGGHAPSASTRQIWSEPTLSTEAGRSVLMNASDHIELNGIDRWLGGVHLKGFTMPWRYDEISGTLVRSP